MQYYGKASTPLGEINTQEVLPPAPFNERELMPREPLMVYTPEETYIMGLKDGLFQANGILLSVWSEIGGPFHPDMDRFYREVKKRIEAKRNDY